jgi:membrane protein DedA with SNARE-associated domain
MSVSPSVRVKSYQMPMVVMLLLAILLASLLGFIWFLASKRKRHHGMHGEIPRAEGPA